MGVEPLFELTDTEGNNHTVRIVQNYVDMAGANLRTAVADVVDVKTGAQIKRVPLSQLIPIADANKDK